MNIKQPTATATADRMLWQPRAWIPRPVTEPAIDDVDRAAVERFRIDIQRLCGSNAEKILLAVSGGADSLALLLLARSAFPGTVRAATVDHGLRRESAAEATFVAEVCRRLHVPHSVLTGGLPERVHGTANLSSRARAMRYDLLSRHSEATGCAWLATAHHADDQVETMVMRLNRGSGLAGISAIRARNGPVVRPLLGWHRAELAAIVESARLAPVADPMNLDDRFDRARIRKALTDADWVDVGSWAVSASALAEAEEGLAWAARRLAEDRIKSDGACVTLALNGEPIEILRRLVAECLTRVSPDVDPRGRAVWRLAERLREAARSGTATRAALAGVLVSAGVRQGGMVATFTPAPIRRHY